MGVRLLHIDPLVLDTPAFQENPPDRCYHCKRAIFGRMLEMANEYQLQAVIDGSNWDDLNDYRPGKRACRELGVRSPLQEAQLTKQEIRELSRQLGLPTWNKPSMACLASRIPYGEGITQEKLQQVELAEELLKEWGFGQYRVRHHGSLARVEVLPEEMHLIIARREELGARLHQLGFDYVSLDLDGYRTGALNEVLPPTQREG
jgi:uncharacterized protein